MNDSTGPLTPLGPEIDESRYYYPPRGDRVGWKQDKVTKEWLPLGPYELQQSQLQHLSEITHATRMTQFWVTWVVAVGGIVAGIAAVVAVGVAIVAVTSG